MRQLNDREVSLLLSCVRHQMEREATIALDLRVSPHPTLQPLRNMESLLREGNLFVQIPKPERMLETRLPSGEKKMVPESQHPFSVPESEHFLETPPVPEEKPKEPERPRRVPFTVRVPPVLPCQSERKHDITVEVWYDEGVQLLTPEAQRIIDEARMQGSISMLYAAVKILHETINRR